MQGNRIYNEEQQNSKVDFSKKKKKKKNFERKLKEKLTVKQLKVLVILQCINTSKAPGIYKLSRSILKDDTNNLAKPIFD